jgi:hypothetical protein
MTHRRRGLGTPPASHPLLVNCRHLRFGYESGWSSLRDRMALA